MGIDAADTCDLDRATEHAQLMLAALGLPCTSESMERTPRRFVTALAEMTGGGRVDPERHLGVTFPPETDDPGMIIVPGVPFVSICEHHLLPFTGTAAVAYLPKPGARIVGLSKLARIVQEFAARPQVQERLGQQVVDAIDRNLVTAGSACIIRSAHSCMTLRGAKAHGAVMITSHLTGVFRSDPAARAEILNLARAETSPS